MAASNTSSTNRDERIGIRLTPHEVLALDRLARRTHRSRSEVVRAAIASAVMPQRGGRHR